MFAVNFLAVTVMAQAWVRARVGTWAYDQGHAYGTWVHGRTIRARVEIKIKIRVRV